MMSNINDISNVLGRRELAREGKWHRQMSSAIFAHACLENQMCSKSHGGNLRYNFCVLFHHSMKGEADELENNC